ncbi:hypothetical protein [Rhodanobacter sp. BL-MT-08]
MDVIDVSQRRQQEDIDHALSQRKVSVPGLAFCENIDCVEAITGFRQAMGARLCIDCAKANELEARRWAPRGQG